MNKKFSLRQFRLKYGTHLECLEAIKKLKYPDQMKCSSCKRLSVFYPVTNRTAYACKFCGFHIYPLAGTIFEKSTTPLDLWFFAMYLMVTTRSGTSAKQLERMLGVTYKTAWRMFKQIRMLMADTEGDLLNGIVEIDETYIGGKGTNRAHEWRADVKKEVVWGAVERKGKTYLKHVLSAEKFTLLKELKEHVDTKAHIMSDETGTYRYLYDFGYFNHFSVNHSMKEFGRGLVHNNTIEGVWSQLKRGITGVYRHVSREYLQDYVNEYSWRYNHRNNQGKMFELLLRRVVEVKALRVLPLF